MFTKRLEAGRHGYPGDFRLICSCQEHARAERTMWRRSARSVSSLATHLRGNAIAIAVGLPLAFGAIGIPMETIDGSMPSFTLTPRPAIFAVFGPRAAMPAPPAGKTAPRVSLESAKEQFFRTYIPYGPIIYREARKNHLAPELVAAVVAAESDYRVRLVSEKDARGLMQIVPATGRLLGADDLFDAEQNVAAGAKYLRYLHDRFRDEPLALAAYNAGEGNVEKFGGIPPFTETRNYIQRVARHSRRYGRIVRSSYLASLRLQNAISQ